jgi:hypothetical protein
LRRQTLPAFGVRFFLLASDPKLPEQSLATGTNRFGALKVRLTTAGGRRVQTEEGGGNFINVVEYIWEKKWKRVGGRKRARKRVLSYPLFWAGVIFSMK